MPLNINNPITWAVTLKKNIYWCKMILKYGRSVVVHVQACRTSG